MIYCDKMNDPQDKYTEWKKPEEKVYTHYDSIYIK